MHDESRDAPIEITIRFNPSGLKDSARNAGRQIRAAGEAVRNFAGNYAGVLLGLLSLAIAVAFTFAIGSGKPLAIWAAPMLVYAFVALKRRYSPLIPD
jgi:hypothetical protein